MVGSISRVRADGDNAAVDSQFSLLRRNVLDRRRLDTREDLQIAIVTWIERITPECARKLPSKRLSWYVPWRSWVQH